MRPAIVVVVPILLCQALIPTTGARTIVVTTTEMVLDGVDGACSLPEAVRSAEYDQESGPADAECPAGDREDTIVLQPARIYTFSTTFGWPSALELHEPLTIEGHGATLERVPSASRFGLIAVNQTDVTIEDLAIVGGSVHGAAVFRGSLVATGCAFRNNDYGVLNLGGSVLISDSSILDNAAGILSGGGSIEIHRSTIAGNKAVGVSSSDGLSMDGNLTILNSTISGNGDPGLDQQVGGIVAWGNGVNILENVTLVDNRGSLVGGLSSAVSVSTVRNSIIAGNVPADCGGAVDSAGYNGFGSNGGCPSGVATDVGIDPETLFAEVLTPLGDHGGPTRTHALRGGSAAVDAGACTRIDGNSVQRDQRGVGRPRDGDGDGVAHCDIGAFELRSGCRDRDGDGYGQPGSAACPEGDAEDCDDDGAASFPGALELCDGIDNDCDGVLPGVELDQDEDGVRMCGGDCDDLNASVFPGAVEVFDGEDNDCDGPTDEGLDTDRDGIPNFNDACPGTPPGSGVDPSGCALCSTAGGNDARPMRGRKPMARFPATAGPHDRTRDR